MFQKVVHAESWCLGLIIALFANSVDSVPVKEFSYRSIFSEDVVFLTHGVYWDYGLIADAK